MKVYLAGSMSGHEDFNFPSFFAAAKLLEAEGHEVFNPAAEDMKTWKNLKTVKKKANYRDCLRKDLNWILDHADCIAILPGWQRSKGVRVELALAKALGIEVRFLRKDMIK